ncbi:metal ABC transporter ATP-binding protein [Methanothrix sp.]|uniref:metal ABC transporter ATP-binding protein n=1 Tax=Methanothrix sp. TaxID=90426 RepID=UPI003C750EF4
MSAVSIEGLTVRLDGRIVLEDVWLEVEERDFLGLIGPNGGGKSTLLKAILGLVKPSSGRIRVFGRDPVAARALVGYLPQHSIFDQRFPVKVLDVVLMGRYPRVGILRRYRTEDMEAARSALDAVGMLGLADREIGALSGGEQQRVFVARAIVSDPKLLLLDEPTAGVDVAQQREFYDLLKQLNSRMAIIMVSHDLSAISAHVEKVACLNQRLYYHGSKELTEEDLAQAYGCPIVDMIAHGIPHRVLREHR